MKWVSVKDKLPAKDDKILAFSEKMRNSECCIQITKGWCLNNPKGCVFSHWMPLPAKPKEV